MNLNSFARSTLTVGLVLFALGMASAGPAATLDFSVTIDTSTIQGDTGNLIFQFNATQNAQAGTATVTMFSTNGTITGAATDFGSASGSLPGTLVIPNTFATEPNAVEQPFTYGSFLSFCVSYSGPVIDTPNGDTADCSTFSVSLEDDTTGGTFPLATSVDGSTFGQCVSNGMAVETNGPPFATASLGCGPAVPEPATFSVLALALLAVAGYGWRRRVRR